MNKLKTLALLLWIAISATAQDESGQPAQEPFDWEPVINAIAYIESRHQPNARCGQYLGILQIAPVMVRECNNILKQRGDSRRFTYEDRRSPEKSKEMFRVIMSKYNPENDIDKACRLWKAGIGYNIQHTQKFVNRVRAIMKQQQQANEKKD